MLALLTLMTMGRAVRADLFAANPSSGATRLTRPIFTGFDHLIDRPARCLR
jgi:hypothetical protein